MNTEHHSWLKIARATYSIVQKSKEVKGWKVSLYKMKLQFSHNSRLQTVKRNSSSRNRLMTSILALRLKCPWLLKCILCSGLAIWVFKTLYFTILVSSNLCTTEYNSLIIKWSTKVFKDTKNSMKQSMHLLAFFFDGWRYGAIRTQEFEMDTDHDGYLLLTWLFFGGCQFRNNIFSVFLAWKKFRGCKIASETSHFWQNFEGRFAAWTRKKMHLLFRPFKYMFTKKQVSHIAVRRQFHTAPWLQECF